MDFGRWSNSRAEYGARLLHSGLQGARSGRDQFLNGRPLTPFLSEAVRHALKPAALGACIGLLGSYSSNRRTSVCKAIAYGVVGGAIGFCTGVAWESRHLATSVSSSALKQMSTVCDEHWLELHPIDYA